jgi:hypothetical protein
MEGKRTSPDGKGCTGKISKRLFLSLHHGITTAFEADYGSVYQDTFSSRTCRIWDTFSAVGQRDGKEAGIA